MENVSMKLYYAPGACSLSPHIALRESGQAFDLVKVDTKTHKFDGGGDFYGINGKGYVPVLELDDGTRLTEGPAIVQYLADRKPESSLAPKAGTMERVRLQEWLNFLTSEVHKGFSPLFSAETPEDYKPVARKRLATRFDWLTKQLEGKDLPDGQAVHGRRRLSFRAPRLDQPRRHEARGLARPQGVSRAHRRAPRGARGAQGGGAREVERRMVRKWGQVTFSAEPAANAAGARKSHLTPFSPWIPRFRDKSATRTTPIPTRSRRGSGWRRSTR